MHNSGATVTYLEADGIQILYDAIKERVHSPGYNPSELETKLLNGVIYHNPNFNESVVEAKRQPTLDGRASISNLDAAGENLYGGVEDIDSSVKPPSGTSIELS